MTRAVIFTREHPLDRYLEEQLEEAGLTVYHIPLIHCEVNPMPKAVLERMPEMDWVFFTSAVAAEFLAPYLQSPLPKIATIGHQTSRMVATLGYTVDFESQYQYAKDFAKEWLALECSPQRILLPQSSLSNPILAESLTAEGHDVLAWPLYDTQHYALGQGGIQAFLQEQDVLWTFASPSAWQSFHEVCKVFPEGQEIAVIGTSTREVVERDGFVVNFMPETPSIEKMVQTIIQERGRKNDTVY